MSDCVIVILDFDVPEFIDDEIKQLSCYTENLILILRYFFNLYPYKI